MKSVRGDNRAITEVFKKITIGQRARQGSTERQPQSIPLDTRGFELFRKCGDLGLLSGEAGGEFPQRFGRSAGIDELCGLKHRLIAFGAVERIVVSGPVRGAKKSRYVVRVDPAEISAPRLGAKKFESLQASLIGFFGLFRRDLHIREAQLGERGRDGFANRQPSRPNRQPLALFSQFDFAKLGVGGCDEAIDEA